LIVSRYIQPLHKSWANGKDKEWERREGKTRIFTEKRLNGTNIQITDFLWFSEKVQFDTGVTHASPNLARSPHTASRRRSRPQLKR
jgi:hypothetical protein